MFLPRKLRYLKRFPSYADVFIFGVTFSFVFSFCLYLKLNLERKKSVALTQPEVSAPITLTNPDKPAAPPKNEVDLLSKPLTILILGLDARRGDQKPRCDAIHLLTFSPPEGKIIITSIPRGIAVELENVATPSAYLGNSCHIKGIDWAVVEISRITNLHPDHIIKINFSQTLGILRTLGIPTTPTLQFLRDRKSYYWGDNQRSHNQALFIKDMMINHLNQVAGLPEPIKYLFLKMVNQDTLDFSTGSSILNWMVKNNFAQNPDKIELVTKPAPFYKINDVHFEDSKFATESAWQNDQEFQDYQSELETYLKNLASQGEKYLTAGQKDSTYQLLRTPFSQSLWLQLENDQLRNSLHFGLLRLYVLSSPDKNEASTLLEDFVREMEAAKSEELKKQAEELRKNL